MTIRDDVTWASAQLTKADVPSARADAMTLAEHILGSRNDLDMALINQQDWEEGQGEAYRDAVSRRMQREPLQHITGIAPFRHLELAVGPGVFIPRPETEVLAQSAIDEVHRLLSQGVDHPRVVDACAGSGAIALAIATEFPQCEVIAIEASDDAAAYAARNIARYDPQGRIRFLLDDVTSPMLLQGLHADVVVSNPPYIPPDAIPIDPEVANFDPHTALYGGGEDGLSLPRAVVTFAQRILKPAGLLLIEHGERQGQEMRDIVEGTGDFTEITTGSDLTGRDRFVCARRSGVQGS